MNGEQWVKLLKKDSLSEKEWSKCYVSGSNWCSCAIGVLLLKDKVIENPLMQLSFGDRELINYCIEDDISAKHHILGLKFYNAICEKNLKRARKIWDEIHGDKK